MRARSASGAAMRQVLDASMMTEEQLLKVVPAETVAMVKNVSRVDQACSLLRSRFEVRLTSPTCHPPYSVSA